MTDSFGVVRLDRELVDVSLIEAELLFEAVLFPRPEALRLLLNTFPDDHASLGLSSGVRRLLAGLCMTMPSVAPATPPLRPPLPLPPWAVESGDVLLLRLSSKYSSGQLRK